MSKERKPSERPERPYLTMGAVARRFRCKQWQVRRLFERNLLPEPARVGAYRVISESDLPGVERALRSAGYIPAQSSEANPPARGAGESHSRTEVDPTAPPG